MTFDLEKIEKIASEKNQENFIRKVKNLESLNFIQQEIEFQDCVDKV